MSTPSWQAILTQRLHPEAAPRLAVVGVGSDLHGDDGAGVAVARALQFAAGEHFLVLDAGPAPENITGLLRRFAPDFVLLVDAADMGAAPGTVRWIAWDEVSGLGASTHSLPLTVISRYLADELGCEVALLGIQPRRLGLLDDDLSPSVQQAVSAIASVLAALRGSLL